MEIVEIDVKTREKKQNDCEIQLSGAVQHLAAIQQNCQEAVNEKRVNKHAGHESDLCCSTHVTRVASTAWLS